ncbi:MAG TPA: hypothetical protein VFN67_35250 [Polyangiales bacterium]|nr:hypothetical protein [Polyangiales bacterium]
MEWGGNYGAVEDIASAPHLILNSVERAQLEAAAQRCTELVRIFGPAHRPTAEAAIDELYALARLRAPRHVWMKGPANGSHPSWRSGEHNPSCLGGSLMFRHDSLAVHFSPPSGHEDVSKACEQDWQRRLELWVTLAATCGGWSQYKRECRLYERATEMHFKPGTSLLHRTDGPALCYADGTHMYAWNGDRVTEEFVAGKLTWSDWLRTNSLRERSTFLDRMGWAWLLEHCPRAHKLSRDDANIMWLLKGEDLGPLNMNFGSGRRMLDIRLIERVGYAKRNVSPDKGESLQAGPIEHIHDDW